MSSYAKLEAMNNTGHDRARSSSAVENPENVKKNDKCSAEIELFGRPTVSFRLRAYALCRGQVRLPKNGESPIADVVRDIHETDRVKKFFRFGK